MAYPLRTASSRKSYLLGSAKSNDMWRNYGQYEPDNLTDSQKDGQTYTMLGAVNKFAKITGITEPSDAMGVKICQVQFETNWEFTPFGEVLLNKNDFSQSKAQVANFVRYQDGWRLE